jgi:hypothetical protein
MKWSDTCQFYGVWKNNQRYSGTMILADGSVYDGQWKNDLFHGEGKLRKSNGIVIEGIFKNGQ